LHLLLSAYVAEVLVVSEGTQSRLVCLQSLAKQSSPPSNAWQEVARSAYEMGSAPAVTAVMAKHATDPELQLASYRVLLPIAAIGLGSSLVSVSSAYTGPGVL
jgi:hypothetical protein